jgi:hypothetical protein
MNVFDATKLASNATDPLFPASLAFRSATDDFAVTRVRDRDPDGDRDVTLLRDALQIDDGQMLATAAILDAQLDEGAGPSANERMRLRARRPSRPTIPRFETRPSASWELTEVDLVGRTGAETRVRPFRVVPGDVVIELAGERCPRQRDDRQEPRALFLQRSDVPLDDGEAAVLADRPESLLDAVAAAPCAELLCRELRAVVDDE